MTKGSAHGGFKPAVIDHLGFAFRKPLPSIPSPAVRHGLHSIVAITTALALILSPLSMPGAFALSPIGATAQMSAIAVMAPSAPASHAAAPSGGTASSTASPSASDHRQGDGPSSDHPKHPEVGATASMKGMVAALIQATTLTAPADVKATDGDNETSARPHDPKASDAKSADATSTDAKASDAHRTDAKNAAATPSNSKTQVSQSTDAKTTDAKSANDPDGKTSASTAKPSANPTAAANAPANSGTTNASAPAASTPTTHDPTPVAPSTTTSAAAPTAQPKATAAPAASATTSAAPAASPSATAAVKTAAAASPNPSPASPVPTATSSAESPSATASPAASASASPTADAPASATLVATASPDPTSSPASSARPASASPTAIAPATAPSPTPVAQVTKAPTSLSTAAIGQMCASNQVVSNVVATCPGSAKATTASSGNAAAQGSYAQTGLNNAQVAGAVAAGGNAPVVVQNSSSSRVDDTGSANAQTGLANAQGASPGATASPTAGTVGATSGNASANGLSAQNTVTNNTRAAVVVGGANNAEVNVASSNQVTVTDNGAASATSGAALASRASNPTGSAATGTLGATRAVASASMPAMVGTTTQINPHGLNASNAFQGTLSTTSTSAPTGPVTINHTEAVTIANNGNAAGTSTGACTGFGCNLPAAGLTGHSPVGTASSKPSSGVARATTGSATARGLVAQNTVNNQASVKVHINGSNYGIINVVVQTVTSIVNWGSAAAQSGSAAALGAATGGPTFVSPVPSPLGTTSENVQATGASVTNRVGLNSSISISTPGDNRNPIQIFVQLLTNLTNRGSSQAFSGTVQSIGSLTGSGTTGNDPTASATSGSVDATGLQVQNLVNLSSDVSINIGGSNYAPIDVYLLLETRIQNLGQALAVSGDARTLGGATAQTSAPSSSGSSSSSTGNASTTGAVGPGTVSATTGSSLASADVSVIEATNAQTAGVSATTPYRAALNAASYAFNTQGVASANSGTASTGPLPVGSATGQSTPPGSPAARQVGGISGAFGTGATPGNGPSLSWPISGASESGSNQNGVSGSVVGPGVVDLSLWAALPDPDAPPMPGQSVMHRSKVTRAQTTTSRVATTSTSIFELQPVPELMPPDAPAQQVQLRSASPSVAPSSSVQRTTVPAAHGTSSATAATTGNVWVTPIVILALILVAAAGLGTIAWRRRMPLGEMIQTALGSISLW